MEIERKEVMEKAKRMLEPFSPSGLILTDKKFGWVCSY